MHAEPLSSAGPPRGASLATWSLDILIIHCPHSYKKNADESEYWDRVSKARVKYSDQNATRSKRGLRNVVDVSEP